MGLRQQPTDGVDHFALAPARPLFSAPATLCQPPQVHGWLGNARRVTEARFPAGSEDVAYMGICAFVAVLREAFSQPRNCSDGSIHGLWLVFWRNTDPCRGLRALQQANRRGVCREVIRHVRGEALTIGDILRGGGITTIKNDSSSGMRLAQPQRSNCRTCKRPTICARLPALAPNRTFTAGFGLTAIPKWLTVDDSHPHWLILDRAWSVRYDGIPDTSRNDALQCASNHPLH
jgi:hypothetical protein